ncbi:hypothetical protein [Haloferula sp.]|uniref:hypothetical protein n=1 Tax=Haloferula sp. TaxID=2497595 RepID=UPI00329B9874
MLLIAVSSTLHAWTPGVADPAPSSGFTVDTSNRNDVVSFWHAVYSASDLYWERIGWTGNYGSTATGAEGTTSQAFTADVERRVNFVRALCGVPSVVSMNTDETVLIEAGDNHVPAASTMKRSAIQRSAFMAALGTTGSTISHDPPTSLAAWTVAAWNGHNKSTISKGFFGPDAVDAYFREDVAGVSNWNYDAGHRRWLLAVAVTDMATGDTPGDFNSATLKITQPSNLIYVKPKPSELSSAAPRFVSYPGAGFFPAGLNTPFWSLSRSGADFSSAVVAMTDDAGTPVSTTVVSTNTGFAENAIVWSVPEEVRALTAPVDRTYHVTVSGIGGGVGESHSWTVTIMDPNRLTDPLDIEGPASPVASVGTEYQLTPVPGCDRMETGFFLRDAATWTETAEDGSESQVVDLTDPSYELRASVTNSAPGYPSDYFTEGTKAFHLTFPRAYDPRLNSIADEVFEFSRQIMAGPGASVEFQFRRGYMTSTTALACESSEDGGLTWQSVGSPLTGAANGQADTDFSMVSLPLAESSESLLLRFRLYRTNPAAGFYDHERYPNYATGAFIDELNLIGCDWLEPGGLIESSPSEGFVEFGSATTSLPILTGQEWCLRTRPVMGGKAFPWGPVKLVTPVGPLGISGTPEPPLSGATYSFIPDPSADSHIFEVSRFSSGNWNEGAETEPEPSVIDGTSQVYEMVSARAGYRISGDSSFRLAVQPLDGEDYLEINREVMATDDSELHFWLRRGWSLRNQLDAEVSIDGGTTWSSVWSMVGKTFGDTSGSSHVVDLAPYAGELIRCRFVVRSTGSVSFNANNSGMWLDDVGMTDVDEVYSAASTPVAAGAELVTFDASSAGEAPLDGAVYRLRMVPVSGGVEGSPGPALFVTPSATALTGYAAWVAYEHPSITGGFEEADGSDGIANGIKYALGIDPTISGAPGDELVLDSSTLTLERDLDSLRMGVIYAAEFSENLSAWTTTGVTVTHADGVLRATVDRPDGAGFLRWIVTEE